MSGGKKASTNTMQSYKQSGQRNQNSAATSRQCFAENNMKQIRSSIFPPLKNCRIPVVNQAQTTTGEIDNMSGGGKRAMQSYKHCGQRNQNSLVRNRQSSAENDLKQIRSHVFPPLKNYRIPVVNKAQATIGQKYVTPKKDDVVNYIEELRKLEKMDEEPFGMSNNERDIEALRKEAALLTKRNREIWVTKDAENKKRKERQQKKLPVIKLGKGNAGRHEARNDCLDCLKKWAQADAVARRNLDPATLLCAGRHYSNNAPVTRRVAV